MRSEVLELEVMSKRETRNRGYKSTYTVKAAMFTTLELDKARERPASEASPKSKSNRFRCSIGQPVVRMHFKVSKQMRKSKTYHVGRQM